jgi:hypothetical protein
VYLKIDFGMNDHHQVARVEDGWRGWLLVVVALLDQLKHSPLNLPTKNSLREL